MNTDTRELWRGTGAILEVETRSNGSMALRRYSCYHLADEQFCIQLLPEEAAALKAYLFDGLETASQFVGVPEMVAHLRKLGWTVIGKTTP